MVGPISNPPISGNKSVEIRDRGPAQNRYSGADSANGSWFLPGNANSLLPITATPIADPFNPSLDSLAERVLSHIST